MISARKNTLLGGDVSSLKPLVWSFNVGRLYVYLSGELMDH